MDRSIFTHLLRRRILVLVQLSGARGKGLGTS
jgi:hypothetical protein